MTISVKSKRYRQKKYKEKNAPYEVIHLVSSDSPDASPKCKKLSSSTLSEENIKSNNTADASSCDPKICNSKNDANRLCNSDSQHAYEIDDGDKGKNDCDSHVLPDASPINDPDVTKAYNEICLVLFDLLVALKSNNKMKNFVTLILLLAKGTLPINNISFSLVLEVAQFLNLETTTLMRYSPQTLAFWKFLYRLVGGTLIRALSGPKNLWQIIKQEATRGLYSPEKSAINFAVPSEKILSKTEGNIPPEVQPGLIESTLDMAERDARERNLEYTLSFDGKLVGPGVSKEINGDVNLWGVEGRVSLMQRLQRLEHNITTMKKLLEDLDASNRCTRITQLEKCLVLISKCARKLRQLMHAQHMMKQRIERISERNTTGKSYKWSLSRINVTLYLCTNGLKRCLLLNGDIARCISTLRFTSQFVPASQHVEIQNQSNVFRLLPPEKAQESTDLNQNPQFIKQGTDLWLEKRKLARVTGSTLHNAIGLRSLKEQKIHHYTQVKGRKKPQMDENAEKALKIRLQHGKVNEIHGLATLVGAILPALRPNCQRLFEVGAYFIHSPIRQHMLEVSPDGVIMCTEGNQCTHQDDENHKKIAVEIKCPFNEDDELNAPHYDVPQYYVAQLLAEMSALDTQELYFISWTHRSTTLNLVRYDEHLFKDMLSVADELYGAETTTVPTRLHPQTKSLRQRVRSFTKTHCKFICEVPSMSGSESLIILPPVPSPYNEPPPIVQEVIKYDEMQTNMEMLSEDGITLLKDVHNLLREPASEIAVFMLNDTHRIFEPHRCNSAPMGYIMKGSSMNNKQLRTLVNTCRNELKARNIPILCENYDGQWAKLCFENEEGFPLTRLGLQKRSWAPVHKANKDKCLKLLHSACALTNGDKDLLAFHMKLSSGEFKFGNVHVAKEWDGSLSVASLGGTLSHEGIVGNAYRIPLKDKENPKERYWLWNYKEEDESGNLVRKKKVIGLQGEEKNLLCLLSAEVRSEIEHEVQSGCDTDDEDYLPDLDEPESELEKVLQSGGIELLTDIVNELQDQNDKWLNFSPSDLFPSVLTNAKALIAACTIADLKVIANNLKYHTNRDWITHKMKKAQMVNSIVSAFGSNEWIKIPDAPSGPPVKKINAPLSLRDLSQTVLKDSTYPLLGLRAQIATALHRNNLRKWNATVRNGTTLLVPNIFDDEPDYIDWDMYSVPEYNNHRQQYEPRVLDVTHIFNNLRTQATKNDLKLFAPHESWCKVADNHPEIISRSIVYDNLDSQNAAFTKRFFGFRVEAQMRENGDEKSADFVRTVRSWYMACDMRGMSAKARITPLLNMYITLVGDHNFDIFPAPQGMHMFGIPVITYEAILQNISHRIMMYSLSKHRTYNQRCVSTLSNESFFSDLTVIDREGLGTPKAANVPRLMSKVCQLNYYKHQPER